MRLFVVPKAVLALAARVMGAIWAHQVLKAKLRIAMMGVELTAGLVPCKCEETP